MTPVAVALVLAGVVAGSDAHPAPPVPPRRAAARMKLPEGFRATLVAGEPDLVKPIAMTTDERGRLWVVESHSYPRWRKDSKPGRDRVLIFEQGDDGRFSRKVFWDRGANLSGIAVGFGGVWLCATPNLWFVPVHPGADRPAGPPEVVLDGWDLSARHNVFNGLCWGPDGWLYGCNGILSNSRVGRPGTPADRRVALNCGVWRVHPTKKLYEVVAHGTTNPWGLDFDERGEAFITNCVIKHLFHVIPGAHYVRMFGQDIRPHRYGLLESCADHIHWGGGHWTDSRGGKGAHSTAGGGHAHAGALVYLGDNWPAEYRNRVSLCNIHGNRVNMDVLHRRGSGYVARHGEDFLHANDEWFRGLALTYGPDGGVYVMDWHDTGECHNYDKVQACGRIFKVVYGEPRRVRADLARASDTELVALQRHRNDWWVRTARRLLQERAAAGRLGKGVHPALRKILAEQSKSPRQLRALWALHVTGGLDGAALVALLAAREEEMRRWAVRLLAEDRTTLERVAKEFAAMAREDPAPSVRLALASALQRLPLEQRWAIAEGLAAHAEDATDANLPLMIWYGVEPLAAADPGRAARLLTKVRIPLVRRFLARRIAEMAESGRVRAAKSGKLDPLVRLLTETRDLEAQRDIVRGLHDGLRGRREARPPEGWPPVYRKLAACKDSEVREKALVLAVVFGDSQALADLRRVAGDGKAPVAARRRAVETLVEKRVGDLVPLLARLLHEKDLRRPALRGLAAFSDSTIPTIVLKHYSRFDDAEKADAVATLASRPSYALGLLDAVERKQVARSDLSAYTARQLVGFNDSKLTERLGKVWGPVRPTAADKAKLLERYTKLVSLEALKKANRSRGRAVYARTCASCHVLFDAGTRIGPELTGSQRTNPDYLLAKILDPNAVVHRDYLVTVVRTKVGRTVSGLVKEETSKVLILQTPTEVVRLAKDDVEERHRSTQSLMPEGQLAMLTDEEVRDLIAYLAGPGQVDLPKGTK
jgi:putative membrane-bound dehydrogenase-like protein